MRQLNNIVLCIDFDDTIAEQDRFPNPGLPKPGAVEYIVLQLTEVAACKNF
jgi:hypothetical protein